MTGRRITPKQDAFSRAYVETGNASEAYRRAYRVSPHTKSQTVHETACRLASSPKVSARIAELQAALAERHAVTVDRIVGELAKLAFSNIADVVAWDEAGAVTVRPSAGLDRTTTAAIASIEQTPTGVKVRLHDKRAALVDLARHLGMFADRVEHIGRNGVPIEVAVKARDEIDLARRAAFLLSRAALAIEGEAIVEPTADR